MKPKIKMPALKSIALELAEKAIDESELRHNDITPLYRQYFKSILQKKRKLLNMQLLGEPGSGKSTVMLAEVHRANKILQKRTKIDYILANQLVYAKAMANVIKEMNICIGIDEYEDMAETGGNSSIAARQLDHYSNLHRAHYVHKIACSPQETIDKNCQIKLEVIEADYEAKITRCWVYIVVYANNHYYDQLVGFANISVANVLDTKFYKEYEKRKMDRLRLHSKHGIRDEREIFTAKLILKAWERTEGRARRMKITRDMARLKIQIAARQLKEINSILVEDFCAGHIIAMANIIHDTERIREKIIKLRKAMIKDLANKERYKTYIYNLQKDIEENQDELKLIEQNFTTAASLEKQFTSTLGIKQ
jgi:hypothetical protein